MPDRLPVVAGRFYPGDAANLTRLVDLFLDAGARAAEARASKAGESKAGDSQAGSAAADAATRQASAPSFTPCVMAPHAGYVFSGPTAGAALGGLKPPKTVVILAPNHTGRGRSRFGVWPEGVWKTPLGDVPVNADCAARLAALPPFGADTLCHVGDHAIEVELPFLQRMAAKAGTTFDIVPVCVASMNQVDLRKAGEALFTVFGEALRRGEAGILVSSDMNHYENEEVTRQKDTKALEHVLAEDPEALVRTCATEHISMCGCGPMAIALHALKKVRATPSRADELVSHTTSGKVAKDFNRVVGYAGVRFYL